MAKKMDSTLLINGESYDVSAKTADMVSNKLTINKIKLGDKTEEVVVEFDGSEARGVKLVPADGGRFTGRITVPSFASTWDNDPETVLNYKDIQDTVLAKLKNTSVLYTWSGTTISPVIKQAIAGISLVTGLEEHLAEFIAFAGTKPTEYLYICSDTGNIYLGTSTSAEVKQLATTINGCTISVDLSSDAVQTFTGLQPELALGVTGELPIKNGGTGAADAATAAENIITGQSIRPASIRLNNPTDIDGLWAVDKKYGLDMVNSDIVNLNGLFFADASSGPGEGLHFMRTKDETAADGDLTTHTYDRVYAHEGHIYFAPDCTIQDQAPTKYEVYHGGGPTIPVAKGGTGQTSLSNVTVGKSDKIKTKLVVKNASNTVVTTNPYINLTISYDDPSGGADGDIWIKY